jgi:hypothetical protein
MELFKGPSCHRPLRGDEIRLLKLLPGSFNDPIICYLEHESLASAPRYDALSYTWGDATRTSPIMLDGVQYPITTNLEAALRHVRHPEGILSLWADAVCVNQLDIQERNVQVARMRDIYEQANRTVIWLGDYAPQTKESVDSAFNLVGRVFDILKNGGNTDTNAAVQDIIKDHDADVRVLMDIVQRPWFNRVWVIQEIAMCKTPEKYFSIPDEPGFILGHSRILFTTFCLSTAIITSVQTIGEPPEHFRSRGPNDVVWIHDMRRMRNELLTGKVALNQAEQLVTFVSRSAFAFEATDERDKIYALLGLLSSKILPPQLQPNYALTVEQIFWDYAVYMLEETKCLDILTCCSGLRPGLPSWVPDWKNGGPSEHFHIGKVSYIRFLEGNKKMEIDCMVLSRIAKVLGPVEVAAEFTGLVDLEWESEDSAVMLPQSQEKIVNLAKAISKIYAVLLSVETRWFGCRALDANLTPVELDRWIAALEIRFRGIQSIDDPRWNGYSARQLYERLVNLPTISLEANFDFFSAISGYCAMIKLALRASMF